MILVEMSDFMYSVKTKFFWHTILEYTEKHSKNIIAEILFEVYRNEKTYRNPSQPVGTLPKVSIYLLKNGYFTK